jgi:kumamolisin
VKRLGGALAGVLAVACVLPAIASAATAAPAGQQIQIVLPLTANLSGLSRLATAVSTPGSADYGDYQPLSVLARRFGATSRTRQRVVAYLRRAGATAVRADASGLFVEATMRTGLAERLFGTTLKTVRAASGARFTAPAGVASLPRALNGLVSGVVGLDTQPLRAPVARAPRAAPAHHPAAAPAHSAAAQQPSSAYVPSTGTPLGCNSGRGTGGFTPYQYLTAYGLRQLHDEGLEGAGERVALIEVDGFKASDLRAFGRCFGIGLPSIHAFGVGVKHPLRPGPEATLDLEVLTASAPRLSGIDVYETGADAVGSLKAFVAPLENAGFKPQVISASLGLCEPAIREALGTGGLRLAEAEFALAAAGGATVLAASGDSGSADCTENDGTPEDFLSVNFPASSPWVTAVGGTNLSLTPQNTISSEDVWNDTDISAGSAGGGGQSELFGRPSYQTGTVSGSRRVLPDVAMLADVAPGYAVYCTAGECLNGAPSAWQNVGGTSAATPLLAGGVAIIDQLLRQRERADIGQLNPLLYRIGHSSAAATVFNDVQHFSNDVGPYIPETASHSAAARPRRATTGPRDGAASTWPRWPTPPSCSSRRPPTSSCRSHVTSARWPAVRSWPTCRARWAARWPRSPRSRSTTGSRSRSSPRCSGSGRPAAGRSR